MKKQLPLFILSAGLISVSFNLKSTFTGLKPYVINSIITPKLHKENNVFVFTTDVQTWDEIYNIILDEFDSQTIMKLVFVKLQTLEKDPQITDYQIKKYYTNAIAVDWEKIQNNRGKNGMDIFLKINAGPGYDFGEVDWVRKI